MLDRYKCYVDWNALVSSMYALNFKKSLDFIFLGWNIPMVTTPIEIKLISWIFSLKRVFKMQIGWIRVSWHIVSKGLGVTKGELYRTEIV